LAVKVTGANLHDVPNLVDPATGDWGKVLLDPLNSSMTTTMANLDTLGSLITAYFTVANDDWRTRFLLLRGLCIGSDPSCSSSMWRLHRSA